jgi:hypothetical protein
VIAPYNDWPKWLQALVMVPHCALAGILMYKWWPKTKADWRKFEITLAYLIVFFLVMHYVFHL